MRILYQGDSLTECNRHPDIPDDLGNGYVAVASRYLVEWFPRQRFEFINRGVSGDRTWELLRRWQRDTIDLQPDIMTLMIGGNDTWRRYDRNDPTSVPDFERNLRTLLEDVRRNTKAKVLMIEPFLVHEDTDLWREDFAPKINAFRRVAREFADGYLPMDGLMAMMCVEQPPKTWSLDGVHLIQPGIERMGFYVAEALRPLVESLLNA